MTAPEDRYCSSCGWPDECARNRSCHRRDAGEVRSPYLNEVDVLRVYGQDKLIEKARALRAEEGGTPAESFAKVVVRLA